MCRLVDQTLELRINMLRNVFPFLLTVIAPVGLMAQQVELRSSDEFISVEGEIVGFNGVMLSVDTAVGQVSVPASEIICYGPGCLVMLASNNFGLTADAFDGIAAEETVALESLSDDFVISFAAPSFNALYQTIAGGFAVSSQTSTTVELTAAGQMLLRNETGNETATLNLATGGAASDLRASMTPLRGASIPVFASPVDWATTTKLPNQLIGLGAFAVVVSADVDIAAISVADLAGIYAGDIKNWSEIGGQDQSILPLQLPIDSPLRDDVVALVMEPEGKAIAPSILTMADEASIATSVNQFPGSISVISLPSAAESTTIPVSGACGVPVAPTQFNIISGDYPLLRPIMVTYDRPPSTSLLTELFDYATSDVTQGLLEQRDFINHRAQIQDGDEKNARVSSLLTATLDDTQRAAAAEMFQTLFGSSRLSSTMTGGQASGPESAWNRAMFHDLRELARDGALSGQEIMFVGFGDSTAGNQDAIAASARAASDMQAAFGTFAADAISQSDLTLSSFGFGSLAPATCYEGQVSGPTQTRVEVWVR